MIHFASPLDKLQFGEQMIVLKFNRKFHICSVKYLKSNLKSTKEHSTMKKLISVILSVILAFTMVSCSNNSGVSSDVNTETNTNLTVNEIEEKCTEYVYYLTIVLEYEWDADKDSAMYNYHNAMFFKSALQSLYKYDYGKEIHNDDGYVAIDDYIDICKKHFPVDVEAVDNILKNSGIYDEATNSVTMTEGIGSIKLAAIDDIAIAGNVIEISYSVGDTMYDKSTETYFPDNPIKGTLVVEIIDNNYVFASNNHIFTDCGEKESAVIHTDYLPQELVPTTEGMDRMEIIPLSEEYDFFIMDDNQYSRCVVFSADTKVKNFELYRIAVPAGDKIEYHCEKPVLHYDDISSDKSIVIQMDMPETLPWYGISYTNESGDTVKYAIHVSGYDGSVVLEKFE